MAEEIHGEIGVLAYDALLDRIQCHACGRWYQKLTSFHLKRHGLTIAAYKELYGLNVTTALETPRIRDVRRHHNARTGAAQRLIPAQRGAPSPGGTHPNIRRAQYLRVYHTPEAFQAAGRARRTWTDEEMLERLRQLQQERGGVLCIADLRDHRLRGRGELPTDRTVIRRFGSWRRVCELLGQPYRRGRTPPSPGTELRWTDEAKLAALRALRAELGQPLTATRLYQLRTGQKGKIGAFPSYKTVHDRFGSWPRVCELLDQPDGR